MFSLRIDTKKSKKERFLAVIKGIGGAKQYVVLREESKNQNDGKKEVTIESGKLVPLPNPNIVEKIYISAPSGAGKSYYAGMWLQEYKKMKPFKKNPIVLISSIDEDESLDRHKPIRIPLTMEFIEDPIQPEDLQDSVVVFDDIDTMRDPLIRNAVADLRNYLLEQGRHFNVRMLMTSHLLTNFKYSRIILNEATCVVLFPHGRSKYHMDRYLKVYVGLSREEISRVLNVPSRWVAVYTGYPTFVIHEKGAFLL